MSTATEEAIENRHAKYAMKFFNDSGGDIPTDAKLAEVLAGCARPPRPEEFRAIRQHVYTYLEGREARGRKARALLLDRAESYSSDAAKFRDPSAWPASDTMPWEERQNWATVYRTIAAELRKVAASL